MRQFDWQKQKIKLSKEVYTKQLQMQSGLSLTVLESSVSGI